MPKTSCGNEASIGVVTHVINRECRVRLDDQEIECLIESKRGCLAVGDQVHIAQTNTDRYQVMEVLSRETALYRGDRRSPGQKILIAANIDQVLVVSTADSVIYNTGYLASALVAAGRTQIDLLIYLSHWDVTDDGKRRAALSKLALYQCLAQPIIAGSALATDEDLHRAVKGRRTAVIGERGCGKTTLIHRILASLSALNRLGD